MGYKTNYSDLDIIRSDVAIKEDSDLEKEVLKQIVDTNPYLRRETQKIPVFYQILEDKLKDFDKKGAKIDFSTLAMAAARKKSTTFIDAYRAVKADLAYQIGQRRSEKTIKNYIIKLLCKWPRYREFLAEQDKKFVDDTAFDEIHAHVMTGRQNLKDQVKHAENVAIESRDRYAHLGKIKKSRKAKAEPKRHTTAVIIPEKLPEEITVKYSYPATHPDCRVPEGYVGEYEWLIDMLIQDVFEKLDSE